MKVLKADLLNSVVGSYDQSKTTIQGRVAQKTISGGNVLGPPLSKFIDMFSDTGSAPLGSVYISSNGRILVLSALAAGVGTLHLYDFNFTTGVSAYVGRINFTIPNTAATTHTTRGLRVYNDAGATGWKIALATTGSVLINGGVFILNSIDKADFVQVSPPTIAFATGDNQKAVYFLHNPAAIGVGNVETAVAGLVLDSTAGKLYSHNGISATHQYYVRDLTASLTYPTTASVVITVASPGKVQQTAHGYAANDPVIFLSGTTPTGLAILTVYFVRNPTANDYEVSATSGGASINTTGSPGSVTVGRAFGTSSAAWLFKTNNLPALSGTLLNSDSEKKATPVSSPQNGGLLNGNACAFFATSTNLYMGLLSELTNGATTWPSLTTSNVLGSTNEITTPLPTFASWSDALDCALFVTNTSKVIFKQLANNLIRSQFGELNNFYYEGYMLDTVQFGMVTVINFSNESGWVFIAGGTTGQRGIICVDVRSDSYNDYSYIVTKVMNTPNSVMKFYQTWRKLVGYTGIGGTKIQYRTSGFGSISGGWTDLANGADLGAIVIGSQIQFKILFNIQSSASSSPAQVNEFLLAIESNSEISDYWEYSQGNSSAGSPTRAAFRLKAAYATVVPQLFLRAYDLSDSLLTNHNTVANAANFEYSTNNGSSWNPLGTIPNTVGTLIRYNFTSPPGVDIRPGLKEA